MTSNPAPIVPPRQQEFQHLLASVTGPDARAHTAYPVELTLVRRRLALGAALARRLPARGDADRRREWAV